MKPIILLFSALVLLTSTTFKQGAGLKELSASSDTFVTAIGVCEKYFWIGTNKGLWKIYRSNGKKVHYNKGNSILPSDNVSSIAVEPDGNLWVGTNKGIMRYDNYTFYLLTPENTSINDLNVTSITIDANDKVWLGTAGSGITLIKKNKKELRLNAENSVFLSDSVLHLISCFNGAVFAEFSNGIKRVLNYKDNKLENKELNTAVQAGSIDGIVVSVPSESFLLQFPESQNTEQGGEKSRFFSLSPVSSYIYPGVAGEKNGLKLEITEDLRLELSKYLVLRDLKVMLSIGQ